MNIEYFWLYSAIFFGIVEFIIPGLISIWFAIGSIITFIYSKFDMECSNQILIFIISSFGVLILLKRISSKFFNKNLDDNELNRIIGKKVTIDSVEKNNNYIVYLDGKYWTAISINEIVFSVGDIVKVKKIQGVKLVLEK